MVSMFPLIEKHIKAGWHLSVCAGDVINPECGYYAKLEYDTTVIRVSVTRAELCLPALELELEYRLQQKNNQNKIDEVEFTV